MIISIRLLNFTLDLWRTNEPASKWYKNTFTTWPAKCRDGWAPNLGPKTVWLCCLVRAVAHLVWRWYISVEQRWHGNQQGKQNNSEKNLLQCHVVHHESHLKSPGLEPGHRGMKPAASFLCYGTDCTPKITNHVVLMRQNLFSCHIFVAFNKLFKFEVPVLFIWRLYIACV
jgi:hypothetical protein